MNAAHIDQEAEGLARSAGHMMFVAADRNTRISAIVFAMEELHMEEPDAQALHRAATLEGLPPRFFASRALLPERDMVCPFAALVLLRASIIAFERATKQERCEAVSAAMKADPETAVAMGTAGLRMLAEAEVCG